MRRTTHFLLGAVVGMMLLMPAQEALAQRTRGNGDGAVTYQVRNPRMFTVSECGEYIDIDGFVEIKRVQNTSRSGNSQDAWHVNGKGSGVSRTSGAIYQWKQNTLMRIAGDEWDGGAFSRRTNTRTRLIGQGNAPNYELTLHMHITKNASGEVSTYFYTSDVTCR